MPVPPYTWQVNDWLTAGRLNTELYRTFGLPFHPNGTGFHAAKPIYRSYSTNGPSFSGTAWTQLGHTASANYLSWPVIIDTASMFGSRTDPIQAGTVLCGVPNAGGIAGTPGGLGLVSAFVAVAAASAGAVGAGLGAVNLATPTMFGTGQIANSTYQSTPWALDILDLNNAGTPVTAYGQTSISGPSGALGGSDGSGQGTRLQAHWASVYPANGTTVSAIPSLRTSYGGSTNLTAAMMNANLQQLFSLLNMPPLLRVSSTGFTTTSIPSGAATTVNLGSATYDTYTGWSNATNTYTVPLPGIYLVAGFTPFPISVNTHIATALKINSSTFFGPSVTISTGMGTVTPSSGKVGIFDLNQGDTIQLQAFQQSGSSQNAEGSLVVLFLGAQGAPSPLPSVPDPAYSFQAGTPGSQMAGLLNAHLANDLSFLLNRPYFLGYQSTAQLNASEGVSAALSVNQVKGLVHGIAGDPWNGWSSGTNTWAAPVNGWYMAVEEIFAVPPTLAGASCQAQFTLSVHGTQTPDVYQANNCAAGVSNTGASAIAYYYLRAGDTIQPTFWDNGFFSSGNVGTNVGTGINSHFEVVWLGE